MWPSLVLCSDHPSGRVFFWRPGREEGGEREEGEVGERVEEVELWGRAPFWTG